MEEHRVRVYYEDNAWDCSCGVYGDVTPDGSLVAWRGSSKSRVVRVRRRRPARKWKDVKASVQTEPLADWERELLNLKTKLTGD